MPQVTIRGANALAEAIENELEEKVNQEAEDLFMNVANDAVNWSPIYSGAYVKSFSFKTNNTSSRGRGIDGRNFRFKEPTGTATDREIGRRQLTADIAGIMAQNNPVETSSYTIRNDAGHAPYVENGGNSIGPKPANGYKIFARLRSKYG